METNTLDFPAMNSVTGRPYGDGFLFMGVTDGSIPNVSLDKDFFIEFSYRITKARIGKYPDLALLNAHRLTLGFNLIKTKQDQEQI